MSPGSPTRAMNYLATGENPDRLGNQHPNIVPYQVMPSADGYFVLSVGNDPTFERFCKVAGCENLLDDDRFKTAVERVRNRDAVTETLNGITRTKPSAWWIENLEKEEDRLRPDQRAERRVRRPAGQGRARW